jgi:protein Tex
MDIIQALTARFHLQTWQVENTVKLIDEGNTIPFIARYRKEAHGTLDDQVLRELSERLEYLRNLEKRRDEVFASIDGQEKMTDEIAAALKKAETLAEIEDIYRPYKPKRRTRASVAREKGLEPLAEAIYAQAPKSVPPAEMALAYIDAEKGVETAQDALQGAMDIIAENISDDANIRRKLRYLFTTTGIVESNASDDTAESVYTIYYSFSEPVNKIAGHRILAVDRGERESFLKVGINVDTVKAADIINAIILAPVFSPCTEIVRESGKDAYERLIFPSLEREIRTMLTERAATAAIKVFSDNLRELLLQPPVKGNVTLGLDPGYRTGCKTAVVDATGMVLDTGVLYITHSAAQKDQSKATVKNLIDKYNISIIAIGNGTASKETEMFAAEVLKEIKSKVAYMVVNESGASVYSASKLAAEEFPQFDVSVRSAVSIARRLQDPLAELVKIDPKAIGVGQYQHDMPQKELGNALDGVVEYCVTSVGVDLNTASHPLLARVSGINASVAKNIVAYREENGAFSARSQLLKVPKLGAKAFEQCAGFLRIAESKNVLDNTGVHPESYTAAKKLLELCEYKLKDVAAGNISELPARVAEIGEEKAAKSAGTGVPTLKDIVKELMRPGRDPRDELPPPMLRTDVMDIKDLVPGMELKGTIRNVIDFGAFVDIGVHQDGLVHISQITDRFIKHPSDVLKVGEIITVWIVSVDIARKRIALTMKKPIERKAEQ